MRSVDFSEVPKHFAKRTNEEMKKVLMDPEAEAPETHYYMIRGGKDVGNITVWEPGIVGKEFVKTFGHVHVGNLSETYQILSGEGVVLLQKMNAADPAIVEEFRAISVKAGDSVFIDSGYGHLVVNTGNVFLVTADDSPVNFEGKDEASMPGHADYSIVEKMRGFAFYVISDNGKAALVPNKLYREIKSLDSGGLPVL